MFFMEVYLEKVILYIDIEYNIFGLCVSYLVLVWFFNKLFGIDGKGEFLERYEFIFIEDKFKKNVVIFKRCFLVDLIGIYVDGW